MQDTNYSREALWNVEPLPIVKRTSPLVILAMIAAYLLERAADVLPTIWADDPNEAATIYGAFRQWQATGETDALSYLSRLAFVPAGGWALLPIVAEALQGETLADGKATSNEPRVFTTTVGHNPSLLGEYKTYRHHLRTVDTLGNVGYGHDLTRQANVILRQDDGELGDMALIGTQDESWPQVVHYRPITVETVAGAKGDAWLLVDGEPATSATTPAVRCAVAVGSQYKPNGDLARKVQQGRHRTVSYSRRASSIVPAELDVFGAIVHGYTYTSTSGTVSLTTRLAGFGKITGHGRWVRPTASAANQPTSGAARKAKAKATRAKVTTYTVDAPDAPHAAATHALAMTEAQTLTKGHDVSTAGPISSFRVATSDGSDVFTVSKQSGRPFRIVHVRADGSRTMTTTTAPIYVGRAVANRLQLQPR